MGEEGQVTGQIEGQDEGQDGGSVEDQNFNLDGGEGEGGEGSEGLVDAEEQARIEALPDDHEVKVLYKKLNGAFTQKTQKLASIRKEHKLLSTQMGEIAPVMEAILTDPILKKAIGAKLQGRQLTAEDLGLPQKPVADPEADPEEERQLAADVKVVTAALKRLGIDPEVLKARVETIDNRTLVLNMREGLADLSSKYSGWEAHKAGVLAELSKNPNQTPIEAFKKIAPDEYWEARALAKLKAARPVKPNPEKPSGTKPAQRTGIMTTEEAFDAAMASLGLTKLEL